MRPKFVLLAILLLAAPLAAGPPSPPQRDLPGETLGETVSRWIAPYVLKSEVHVGGRTHSRIRWFDEAGGVVRDLSGPSFGSRGPFISGFSILGDFRLRIPHGAFGSAYTSDGGTAAFLRSDGGGEVLVLVYRRGRYSGMHGPWKAGGDPRVFVGEDGSLGVLVRGTMEKPGPGLVVIAPDGTESPAVPLDGMVGTVHPGPGGRGTLVEPNRGGYRYVFGDFVRPVGENLPISRFVSWAGNGSRALFESRFGHNLRYYLVDCATGRKIWSTDPMATAGLRVRSSHVTGADGYLLLHGLEFLPPRNDPGPSRTTLAIGMKTGAAVARWRSWPFPRHQLSPGSLMVREGQLFLVADDAFSRVIIDDIENSRHGWEDYREGRPAHRPASSRRTDERRAPFCREKVRAMLPEGWSISREAYRQVPDGWRTRDGGGVLIEGKKEEESFRMWFLPQNWVGIRMPDARWHRGVWWEGIVLGGAYKIIVDSGSMQLQRAAYGMLGRTPSLVNGGMGEARRIFGSDFAVAERKARRLIEEHCPTPAAKDVAARSLVVLGVPAMGVIRERALAGAGEHREYCVSATGQIAGKGAVEALGTIVRDPDAQDGCRRSAALGLTRLADPAAGQDLHAALDLPLGIETAGLVSMALARIRHGDAAPKILEWMLATEDPPSASYHAEALGILRYRPADEAIRELACELPLTAEWALGTEAPPSERRLGMALLRLTGDWGRPANGVRLMLLVPEIVRIGKPIHVALLIENSGEGACSVLDVQAGTLYVDGAPLKVGPDYCDGMLDVRVNSIFVLPRDLTETIAAPGTYRIRYEARGARANEVELSVGE